MVDVVIEQFTEDDPERLLRIAKTIGSHCTLAVAYLTEAVTGENHPRMLECAKHFGAYSELLDNMYEIDEDLEEGSRTYATAQIRREGDSRRVRKEIRERMGEEARCELDAAYRHVDPGSREESVLDAVRQLIELKYSLKQLTQFFGQFSLLPKKSSVRRESSLSDAVLPSLDFSRTKGD